MRVLLLHNRYRLEGGEERAVADIARLLTEHGHDAQLVERSSADASRGRVALGLLGGGVDANEVARAVRSFEADVVHAHNVHPLLGWRSLAAARATGARTVLHLHNFRLFCAIGVAYRDGAPCFRCRGRDTRPGVRLRCRGSLAESLIYGAALHRQQPQLFEHVDQFVAVSEATATRLRHLGLPTPGAAVLPNFIRTNALASDSCADRGTFALAAGRLVAEKGFETAIAAARAAGVPLVIAGAGPDEPRLRALADGEVRFTGRLQPDELSDVRKQAAVVLVPSRWEEPCPYAALDALAAGVPVLAADRGGLAEVMGEEAVLPADDLAAWTAALSRLWHAPELRLASGREGLERVRRRFGEERYLARLLEIYRRA